MALDFLDERARREYVLRVERARKPIDEDHQRRLSHLNAKIHAHGTQNSGPFIASVFNQAIEHCRAIIKASLDELFSLIDELDVQLRSENVITVQNHIAGVLNDAAENAICQSLAAPGSLDLPTANQMAESFRTLVQQEAKDCVADVELRAVSLTRKQKKSKQQVTLNQKENNSTVSKTASESRVGSGPVPIEDSNKSPASGYYVFFRCWQYFTDPFPFDEFNNLPDNQIIKAIEAHAQSWWRENEALAREQIKTQRMELEKEIKERAMQRSPRPGESFTSRSHDKKPMQLPARYQTPKPGEIPSPAVIAQIAGWFTADKFGDLSPSGRRIVARLDDEATARNCVTVLQKRFDEPAVAAGIAHIPIRFSYLSAHEVADWERALNQMSLTDAQNARPVTVLDAFQKYLCEQTVSVLRALGVLAPEGTRHIVGSIDAKDRFTSFKRKLGGFVDELIARFDNAEKHGGFMQLFDPATNASLLSAKLGFPNPPVEFIVIRRPDHHELLVDNPDYECVNVLRFNDPTGLTYFQIVLGVNAANPEFEGQPAKLEPPTPQKMANMREILESWQRAVVRLHKDDVQAVNEDVARPPQSLQMLLFVFALRKEFAGIDKTTFEDAEVQAYLKSPELTRQFEEMNRDYTNQHPLAAKIHWPELDLSKKSDPKEQQYVFRLTGEFWEMQFGTESGHFNDSKGYGIIHRLLQSPNPSKAIPALELALGGSTQAENRSFQEQLDDEAIRSLKERLKEIPDEIEEANERESLGDVEKLEKERDEITHQLTSSLGFGGNSRPLGPASAEEKARISVKNAISRGIERLRSNNSPLKKLAEHLEDYIKTEQYAYAYRPPANLEWVL
jgi:hypothetical protein